MEVIYFTSRNRVRSITYSNPTCRYMDIRDPSSNKLESPKWSPVLLWAMAVSGREWLRVIQIQGFPKRSRGKIFKLPVEQKRNHFENYVDSPLCKERQLILCSKAGSQVKRGWGWEFDQTVECILASKGNIVHPPFLSQNSYWLGIAACLLSCKLELKISTVPAAAVLCTCQQLLWQLQTGNEVMNGCANNRKMPVRHNHRWTKQ